MRRRLTLLWAMVVVLVALMLPAATVAGSGYSYVVKHNECHVGYDPHFKVRLVAAGWTPADGLTIDFYAQRRSFGSSTWQNWDYLGQEYYYFTPNGYKHWLTGWRTYDGSNNAWYRIKGILRVWDGSYLLAKKVVKSVAC